MINDARNADATGARKARQAVCEVFRVRTKKPEHFCSGFSRDEGTFVVTGDSFMSGRQPG
jgi:hypothetical protein